MRIALPAVVITLAEQYGDDVPKSVLTLTAAIVDGELVAIVAGTSPAAPIACCGFHVVTKPIMPISLLLLARSPAV